MWHRALLTKTTAPDGTQKVQLKPLARATDDLDNITKELKNLKQLLAPWQLTNPTPKNPMESAMPNTPRDRALARSKLPQPSSPLLERCTKAGLVMPPASEKDNGGYMQDNAQEIPLFTGRTHACKPTHCTPCTRPTTMDECSNTSPHRRMVQATGWFPNIHADDDNAS